MLLQDFVVLHFMDIDQTPSRKWAGASSCYLKTEYADDSVLDTSSLSVESETHPPARTQTLARRHREQKLPSLSSASSCRRARENLVCNGHRAIRHAWRHPARLPATTATCYRVGARRRSWYWPSSSGRSD